MKRTLERSIVYPHPVERVWRALTDREALAQWLMPGDFEPVLGREFQFRAPPAPGWDGDGLKAVMVSRILGRGWPRMFDVLLPAVMDQLARGRLDPDAPEFCQHESRISRAIAHVAKVLPRSRRPPT